MTYASDEPASDEPASDEPASVYIALGSNIGDRRQAIERALHAVNALPDTSLIAASALYETKACFVEDQPDFLNACAHFTTDLTPYRLLKTLLAIEHAMGRVREIPRGPRVIDLDILFYDDQIIETQGLIVPHPDLHRRDFVLRPLNEIAPDFIHPVLGQSIKTLFNQI